MPDAECQTHLDDFAPVQNAAHHMPHGWNSCSAPLPTLHLQMLLDLADHRAGVMAALLRQQQQVGHEINDIAGRSRVTPSAVRSFGVEVCVEGDLSEFDSAIELSHGRSPRPPSYDYPSRFGSVTMINLLKAEMLRNAAQSWDVRHD